MIDKLQELLNDYEEQSEVISNLQVKLLEKSCELDDANGKISKLQEAAVVSEKIESAASKAMALTNINAKLIYSNEQQKQKITKLERELADMKGNLNPKKLKEQNIRIKDKNKELTKGNELLKQQARAYRLEVTNYRKDLKDALSRNAQLALTHVYGQDGHELWLVPNKLGMDRGNGKEFVLVLLHLAPNGIGYLVTVKNGEINLDADVTNKCLPEMPKEMYEHAETWLSKVESQKYQITDADLMALGGFKTIEGI